MRFLTDENVSGAVIERLRVLGFDVTAIAETHSGATDSAVLAMAKGESRILITEDRDFGEMVIRQRLGVCGIILLALDRFSNAGEADRVADIVSKNPDKLAGNLVVIEPARIRVRSLPN
ncbi:MAG TPA: DUF5615 family PIN-like protein [Stellaceae bacterium]|nr:DUF5615 family PIN-like protein [Stellaceae bacterium]